MRCLTAGSRSRHQRSNHSIEAAPEGCTARHVKPRYLASVLIEWSRVGHPVALITSRHIGQRHEAAQSNKRSISSLRLLGLLEANTNIYDERSDGFRNADAERVQRCWCC